MAVNVAGGPPVVITVIGGEIHSAVHTERVINATSIPGHYQLVVARLIEYSDATVLGIVPISICRMQITFQLVAAIHCQLMQQLVAEPVVAY